MRYKQTTFDNILKNNKQSIIEYLLSHIDDSRLSPTKEDKIELDCPYCADSKHKRYKMMINLDRSARVKCYRCGKSVSIFALAKKLGFYNDFISFLQNLTAYRILDLKNIIHANEINNIEENNANENNITKFIKEHDIFPIEKLQIAYKYALSRVCGRKSEVEKYFADEKYIYIPITFDGQIISFIGRIYNDDGHSLRYKTLTVDSSQPVIGFFDDVIENYSINELFIAEGYFDAFAINYSMGSYVAIASMGKGKTDSLISLITNYFPISTKIYLTLDSLEKDKNIYNNNIEFGKKLSKVFESVYIVNLPEGDPADILTKYGPIYLKRCLYDNAIPLLKYTIKNKLFRRGC